MTEAATTGPPQYRVPVSGVPLPVLFRPNGLLSGKMGLGGLVALALANLY